MKLIVPQIIPGKGTATQMSINVTSDPCESDTDNSAQVSWNLFDEFGASLNNGLVPISGDSYVALNTGNYYDNVWDFVANFLNVVLVP